MSCQSMPTATADMTTGAKLSVRKMDLPQRMPRSITAARTMPNPTWTITETTRIVKLLPKDRQNTESSSSSAKLARPMKRMRASVSP